MTSPAPGTTAADPVADAAANAVSVAIIIVSYNTREHLRRCLQSIREHAHTNGGPDIRLATDTRLDTIVVDNASHDGSPELVARDFPEVTLLQSQANLGFTGGNNLALRYLGFARIDVPVNAPAARQPAPRAQSRPDYVWLLNPDTELTPGALPQLLAFMQARPQVGICGPRLRYGDGAFQHAAFAFPDWRQVALDLLPAPALPGLSRVWNRLLHSAVNGRYAPALWQSTTPFPVDFVLGAALFARATAIDAVGGLDDAYFMYCEEMDWCLRMAEHGWPAYAVPAAQVIHHEAQSSRQVRHATTVRLWRSRFYFLRKHAQRYSPLHRRFIRRLARLAWRIQRARAWRMFARGHVDGREVQQELDALQTLMRL